MTNMLGLVHEYDIEFGALILDILLPCIFIYSTIHFITQRRTLQREYAR